MAEPIITLKIDGTSVTTNPVFGDDIKIKFSKEKGQRIREVNDAYDVERGFR